MNAKLIQEIVHLRGGPVVDPLLPVAKKRRLAESRTSASINANHLSKIGMVAVAMKSNIALQHVPTTLVDCAKFIDNFLDGGGAAFKMEDIWGKRLGESCSWWRTLCSSTLRPYPGSPRPRPVRPPGLPLPLPKGGWDRPRERPHPFFLRAKQGT